VSNAIEAVKSDNNTPYGGTTIPKNIYADTNEKLVYCLTSDIERIRKQL
jgi:hypothetical protein